MRIAVCSDHATEGERLSALLRQHYSFAPSPPGISIFRLPEDFFHAHAARPFELVFMDLSGPEGFLQARRLRDMDKRCRIVFLHDTQEYAVSGLRLHFSDYIIRPPDAASVTRALRLAGG